MLKIPSTEMELEKLESENYSAKVLSDGAMFWTNKYYTTTGVDHLKSLVKLVGLWLGAFMSLQLAPNACQ